MKNAFLPASFAVALMLMPQMAVAQNSSIACMYMLLRVYHKEMEYCRVPLTPDREQRYSRLRTNLEKYIRANTKGDAEKMISGIENSEKRAIAGLGTCKSDDFKLAQQALDQLLTPANENVVNQNLKIPGNPQAGPCG